MGTYLLNLVTRDLAQHDNFAIDRAHQIGAGFNRA
jgi:hypothetical protein